MTGNGLTVDKCFIIIIIIIKDHRKKNHIFREASQLSYRLHIHTWVLVLAQNNNKALKSWPATELPLSPLWFVPDDSQSSNLVENSWAILVKVTRRTLCYFIKYLNPLLLIRLLLFAHINDFWEVAVHESLHRLNRLQSAVTEVTVVISAEIALH